MSMIYLASPYSHPDADVRVDRYNWACRIAATLIGRGENTFSPIAHSHPLQSYLEDADGWGYWKRIDREFIQRCDELFVLMIDGWRESVGVREEIAYAKKLGKRVSYFDPSSLSICQPPYFPCTIGA